MYVWLKNNILFSKKRRFSCLSSTEHDVMARINDISLKTQDIPQKLASFESIRLILQVDYKNMYVCLKNNLLFSRNLDFRDSRIRNSIFCIWSMISLWKLKIFVQNLSNSIALVYLCTWTTKTYIFLWKIIFYSRRIIHIRASRLRYTIIWQWTISLWKLKIFVQKWSHPIVLV